MLYQNYKKTRDAAWRILIDNSVRELPVPVTKICRKIGIPVKYDPELKNEVNSGKSTIIDGNPFILIAPDCPERRRRFTIAHELGHIILGHVGEAQLINREPNSGDNPAEQAANVFASRLLAPACVLWGCGVRSAEEISELCDISMAAAEFRYERYRVLLRRNRFLSSPLERAVFNQFNDFIREHREENRRI